MRNIKISDKFKEYFNVENRTETILKSITVVACTLSVILILFMLLSGESSGHNSSYELDSSNGSGYGRPRGQSDTEYTGTPIPLRELKKMIRDSLSPLKTPIQKKTKQSHCH